MNSPDRISADARAERLVNDLISAASRQECSEFLKAHKAELDLSVANALKQRVDQLMRTDQTAATETADLMLEIANLTEDPNQLGVAMLAKANVHLVARAEFEEAVELFDRASSIYGSLGLPIQRARSQIGRVAALANLGRYDDAIEAGERALQILESNEEWDLAIGLCSNLGLAYSHSGDDAKSLEMFERAGEIHLSLDRGVDTVHCLIEMNRSFALRALGRFVEAIQAGKKAVEGFERLGVTADAARSREHLAVTLFVMGHFNDALVELDQARFQFTADHRTRDAAIVDLFRSDCLIELRRFSEAANLCASIQPQFREMGSDELWARALINEASALGGLQKRTDALEALDQVEQVFDGVDDPLWLRSSRLKAASLLLSLGKNQQCLGHAGRLRESFENQKLWLESAQASLLAGKASLALGRMRQSWSFLDRAVDAIGGADVPSLTYQIQMLRSRLLSARGEKIAALETLEQALDVYELVRARVMLEYRTQFQEDKDSAYGEAVRLAIELNRPEHALQFAERAKSRTLVDLTSQRIELRVTARDSNDQHLIDELAALREERDRQYRRWEGERAFGWRGAAEPSELGIDDWEALVGLERQISRIWHRLLVRNADYARDASMAVVRVEPIRSELDPSTVLLEFFIVDSELLAFIVTRSDVKVLSTEVSFARVRDLMDKLRLNFGAVAISDPDMAARLKSNADGILRDLYQLLLEPIEEHIPNLASLIIVPHGLLHYVPFHALRTGPSYLVDRFRISYLPSASLLGHCRRAVTAPSGSLAIGHSSGGTLPHAVLEANAISELTRGTALLEGQATRQRVLEHAENKRILHFATHAEFRPDNPLFSGLQLADGWLAAIDIFSFRLDSSLVTLSACETGQNVVGGGDELLGLMRAFFSAGAASLLVTLWAVEDISTSALMAGFYRELFNGNSKAESLRAAQRAMSGGQLEGAGDRFSHPYFWAPFMLVGEP